MPKRKSRPPKAVEAIEHASDDEEIDEDEAFNSEDEKKYGAFFASSSSGAVRRGGDNGDDDAAFSSDEEEDDDDDDNDNDGKPSGNESSEDDEDEEEAGKAMMDLLESAFGRTVKPATTAAGKIKQKATLDQLLEGLEDARGFGELQNTYRHGLPEAIAPPVPHANKLQRKVHYEMQTETIAEFQPTVSANRMAESLDFRPQTGRILVTRDDRIDQFEPTTEFERKIHEALRQLEAADGGEDGVQNQDDLGDANVDFATLQQRHQQLSKMRSLMFSYEQKRYHMKKIKSRTYRRIRKRQRTREKEREGLLVNDDGADEEEKQMREKQDIERMKERANLTHKNTSKWAKRILKKKHGVDINTRRALSAQLQRAADLRTKLTGNDDNDDDNAAATDEDLAAAARDILDIKQGDHAPAEKGIFAMAFMKKGADRQREQAKEEARALLAELEATNEDHDDDDDGADSVAATALVKKTVPKASKEEMSNLLKDGDMIVTGRKYGSGTVVATSEMVDLSNIKTQNEVTAHVATLDSELNIETKAKATTKVPKKSSPTTKTKNQIIQSGGDDNPWLEAAEQKTTTVMTKKKTTKQASRSSKGTYVDVDRAVDLLDSFDSTATVTKKRTDVTTAEESILESNQTKSITLLTQEELVARAFAVQNEEAIEKEFELEKQEMETADLSTKKNKDKDMTSASGWGSWTGKGAKPSHRPTRFPKGLEPPPPKVPQQPPRDKKKPPVIISKKRMKRMADKYMLTEIPYPFTSREEYEKSLAGGIGPEWNVTNSYKAMTRPEIYTRTGKMIQPISKKMKVQRAPAKF
jgi:U3 small nucleolar RNA-associated protein 14